MSDPMSDPMADRMANQANQLAAGVSRGLAAVPAPGLVLAGVVGLQGGAAVATRLYPLVGVAGATTLRLCLAAVALTALWRPGLRWDRRTFGTIAAAGTLLAVHHLSYYEAVSRLPLGAATTLEFLGPFAIALAGSRRPRDLLCALFAAGGVAALGWSHGGLTLAGAACAVLAGCCWGGYILVGRRLATRVPDGRGLALAVCWAAALSLPYGILHAGAALLSPTALGLALVVALLSSVLPYSCQLDALRRLPPRVFSILTSLEPAVAALVGLLFLGQDLTALQWIGVAAVVGASVAAA